MKRKKLVCLLTAFAVMIGMAGCIKEEKKAEKRKQEVELHILAAASMTDALTEISKTYKKDAYVLKDDMLKDEDKEEKLIDILGKPMLLVSGFD